ncbi:MAG TPA: hypothetical protein VK525_06565 [Candidatus Saccharimonadales bacterium]|nr:hypothetical protein [Candidatus Saccharimonadales bacterium]
MRRFVFLLAFFAVFFSPLCAFAQSSVVTVSRNLSQLVDESPVVMQGWVTAVTLQPHTTLRNLLTVVVTVQVEETLKGAQAGSYTFTQAVIDRRDAQQKMGYRVGQHLLLILIKPNVYGLSSTAGMEQGRFLITANRDGKKLAVNGVGNAGLFRGLDAQLKNKGLRIPAEAQSMLAAPTPGPVSLEQLKTVIRTISTSSAPQ